VGQGESGLKCNTTSLVGAVGGGWDKSYKNFRGKGIQREKKCKSDPSRSQKSDGAEVFDKRKTSTKLYIVERGKKGETGSGSRETLL